MLYEHYLDLANGANELIRSLQSHPDAHVREQVAALLEQIDLLHREALVRLTDALRRDGAGSAFERAAQDPIVRVLLGLYDVVDMGIEPSGNAVGFVPLQQLRKHSGKP